MTVPKDFVDGIIKTVNWKVGNFDILPIVFGIVMALIDISMMGTLKLVDQGKLAYAIGFPVATLLYAFEPYVFLKAMSNSNMVITNLIWNLASNILVTLSGVFFFGESIQAPKWLAIGMSLVSLAIFAYDK
jgi:multidrug transporter EmrE-like cation transporter